MSPRRKSLEAATGSLLGRMALRVSIRVGAASIVGLLAYFGLLNTSTSSAPLEGVAWGDAAVALVTAFDAFVLILFGIDVARSRSTLGVGSFWSGLLIPASLITAFAAERIAGDGTTGETWLRVVSGVVLACALSLRGIRLARTTGQARRVEVRLAIATGGVLLALVLYALSTDAGVALLGLEGSAADRTSGSFGALWVAVLTVSLGALLFMEMAYRGMRIEQAIELRRINAAAVNGLTIALSLVFVASINSVASERDVKRDLSYFKTTRPSETTLRMVRSLDEPVRVVLFYPRVHEVLDQLKPYFDELDAASDQLSVEVLDHALAPELARQHRVRGNGFVLLLRGEGEGQQAESFEVGTDLEAARSRLRTLDGRFQQSFAQLTVRPRELYMTSGHRERSASGVDGDPTEQRLGELSSALQRSNIASRELGIAQGLANQVPESAPAVAVIGPREPLLPEEAQSLLRYVEGGGRLLVFVDPDVDHGLDPLLNGLGVELKQGVLHSAQNHLRHGEPPADRSVVFANNYSAHPTVTLATRYRRAPAVFDRGGALARHEEGQLSGVTVTFPLWAGAGYWLDRNGNHEQDQDEPSEDRSYMMAAITVPHGGEEGRAVIVADGDFITDAWIRNAGNAFVLMDSINWLVGEEQVLGPTQTEEDVRIEHTSEQDKVWFYGTSFAVPLPLLLLGLWMRRRFVGGRVSDHAKTRGAAPLVPAMDESASSAELEGGSAGEESDDDDGSDDDPDDADSDDESDDGEGRER